MKTTKNIARLAVTAGLTAALSFGGVMAPVTMAFAAEGTQGSITIKKAANENDTNTFKAYQIFKAKVDDVKDRGKVASDIKWANDAIGFKVITAITESAEYQELVKTDPTKKLADKPTAPVVAEWLSQYVDGTPSTETNSNGTRVAPGEVLYSIAQAVTEDESAAGNSFTQGELWTCPDPEKNHGLYGDGYYLFVPDGLTDPTKPNTGKPNTGKPNTGKPNTGTSPIFAIVGGNPVVVTEKTSIPTVMKKVKNDDGGGWADKADSQMGEDVHYQLTGTVADNVATFGTYYYEFHDELSAGLTAKPGSVTVTVYADDSDTHGTEIMLPTDSVAYDQTGGKNLLTVKFSNLKAVTAKDSNTPVEITASSKVVVTYTAILDPSKAVKVGGFGNPNSVKLIYSNNPMGDGKGESVPDTVRDYTYALELVKQDADNEATTIDNVRFTIEAIDSDSNNKYVNDKGVLVDKPYEFVTANGGKINVTGLDAGTYKVHEVEDSNPGYNTLDDFTFTIKADGLNKNEGEELDKNTPANTLKVTAQKPESATMVTPSVDGGTVILTVKNKKGSNLPLTGLNGVTFTWIAGGAVLCIGVAHLIRSRKRDDGSEE